jgi:hypothetical protein
MDQSSLSKPAEGGLQESIATLVQNPSAEMR